MAAKDPLDILEVAVRLGQDMEDSKWDRLSRGSTYGGADHDVDSQEPDT